MLLWGFVAELEQCDDGNESNLDGPHNFARLNLGIFAEKGSKNICA